MTVITLARTAAVASYTIDGAIVYNEYRIRLLTNAERDQHAKYYGENRLYGMNDVWVFERGTLWALDGAIIKESWNVFDWANSAEQAAKGPTETAYLTAQSLHYMHQDAVKHYRDV